MWLKAYSVLALSHCVVVPGIYGVLVCLWGIVMLESWKRRQAEIAMEWGSSGTYITQIQIQKSEYLIKIWVFVNPLHRRSSIWPRQLESWTFPFPNSPYFELSNFQILAGFMTMRPWQLESWPFSFFCNCACFCFHSKFGIWLALSQASSTTSSTLTLP